MKRIKVKNPLVVLHGDEMAQVAFDQILKQFIKKYLNITLHEMDLSAKNRLKTNGSIVAESVEKLLECSVGVKNAGITVNKKQLDNLIKELAAEGFKIDKNNLDKLAIKSPNGSIRKGIDGNIIREDIPFCNLKRMVPKWQGKKIDVLTMESEGLLDSFNRVSKFSGTLLLELIDNQGKKILLHSRAVKKGDPYLLATNSIKAVQKWSDDLFSQAIREKRDVYIGLKDTVMPGYDGVIKDAIEEIFAKRYAHNFKKYRLMYQYGLIDAQAALMVVNPPYGALWGIPDNISGNKMRKLVNSLKEFGLPERKCHVAISRMSAGGGDQYGSFNISAPSSGILRIVLGAHILHERKVSAGDPIMLMSNDLESIQDWIEQSFTYASERGQEIYFGLDLACMEYDSVFGEIINKVQDKLIVSGDSPPPFMVMTPSLQLNKMISDPPRNAIFAALNLDGDIFSDITAALGGSLATASSVIISKKGTMLFEAPHGTAPDLYYNYKKSDGKEALFNPSALLYAVANALEAISVRENNQSLLKYSNNLKKALINTVNDGIVTGDIKGKTTSPSSEKIVDMFTFLDEIEARIFEN